MRLNRHALTLIFFLAIIQQLAGKINAPAFECLGNLTNFSYTPPSGQTLSSINWNFGDNSTSSSTAPSHTYAAIGKYKVRVQATMINSTIVNDSMEIEVVGLPKAAFYYITTSDSCFLSNKVCFRDTSNPNIPGQNIVSRMIVWGDGSYTSKSNPTKGDSICHNYQTPDKYTVKIEVTDKYGCKSSQNRELTIAENVSALFDVEEKFINCNTLEVCVKNISTIGGNPSRVKFEWQFDSLSMDTNRYINNKKCVRYQKTKSFNIRLIGHFGNACRDTFSQNYVALIDSLPTFMELLDTVRCFNDQSLNLATIRNVNRDDIRWYVENGLNLLNKSNFNYFTTRFPAGMREVKVEIVRGSCVHVVRGYFRIMGPIASVSVIDNNQCFSSREVYFYDNSKGFNKNHATYKWVIDDPDGESCINYRAKDINKYKNCNESRDWYTRHKFNNTADPKYVFCVVTDTVTGCFDTGWAIINMKYCSKILIPDTFNMCQGDIFKEKVPLPVPYEFTIDSGVNWRDFGTRLDKPLKGEYRLGYVFKTTLYEWAETTGDDSITLHYDSIDYYDTIYRNQLLIIHEPRKDSFNFMTYNECRPFRVTLKFHNSVFYPGDNLEVVWADSGNYDSTFVGQTKVDSIVHIYNRSGFSTSILVNITDRYGCINMRRHEISKGTVMSFSTPKFINCIKDSVCFYPGVYNFRLQKFMTANTPNNKISWYFPDGGGIKNKFSTCVNFNRGGLLPFQMYFSDSFGCIDTLRDSVFIQDVRAGYKHTAKVIYCSELKQFFDSSSFYKNPPHRVFLPVTYIDSIKTFSWQFGNGTFSSLQRNPLQTLNTSLDKIQAAHAVETYSGCKDTVRFEIDVIGPKPYFNIKDTIGCGSLNAEFVNLSRNCKQYIWSFGDSANTNLQTNLKQNVNFNYNKPGRYYINLVGIDTIYNPFTKRFEYCYNRFPDNVFQKDTHRTVLVLPVLKTGFDGPDTICIGSEAIFTSLSDTGYNREYWNFGDTSFIDTLASPSKVSHRYGRAGTFTVGMNPFFDDAIKDQCRDSTSKSIVVLGVKADFDLDPGSKAPLFLFVNKSNPITANYLWDFGQTGGASSTDKDPSYNYGNDTGTYNVCLVATIPYGCSDTVCKQVLNDIISEFQIGNVFTPGNLDGKNDQFDIVIDGESFYELQVFNRWGVLVYEGLEDADDTQGENWNGKLLNTGEDCPSGTYYFIFNYKLKSDPEKNVTIHGTITLIR